MQLQLDATLYPLQAIYGAAYIFIDRCYVFLERPQPDQVRVVLTAIGLEVLGERAKDLAVSYTHLRAHETVLDLVCRLLLEKKNQQQPASRSVKILQKRRVQRQVITLG